MYATPHDPDPLPFLSSRLRAEGMTDAPFRVDPSGCILDRESTANLTHLLRQCSSIVSALSDGNVTYSVRLSAGNGSASTDLARREVIIGLKPLLDPALTFGQRVSLAVAMAYHEVGHIIYSTDRRATTPYAHSRGVTAHTVYNVAQDVHLEAMQARVFPGFAPTLATKEWYFGVEAPLNLTTVEHRRNALIAVALYRAGVKVPTDKAARSWFDRAAAWADRCALPGANEKKAMRALLAEGVDLVEEHVPLPLDPEKSEPDPEGGESGSDEEGEDEQPGKSAPDEEQGGEDGSDPSDEEGEDESDSDGSGKAEPGEDEPDATEQGGSSACGAEQGEGEDTEDGGSAGRNAKPGQDGAFSSSDKSAGSNDLHADTGFDAYIDRISRTTQAAIDTAAKSERISRDRLLLGGYTVAGSRYGKREVRVTRLPRR